MSNFKIDYKKMTIMTFMLVLTTLVISGVTYIFTNVADNNITQTRNVEISALESQLAQLRDDMAAKEVFEKNNQVLGSKSTATN